VHAVSNFESIASKCLLTRNSCISI
jgi:hypothetical protein